jgi:hypothetical protein
MIPPDTHTKLLIQKGGKVDIFRPKLTFTDTGFNTYNLVLNIQLPEAPEMGIVCVNKLIRVTLSGNRKSVLQYNDIKPTCEINTFPNLETGLNIYSFSDSRIYELQYNSPAGSINTFSATGIHRESTFDTDLWEFNFFVNDPADDFITKEEMKTTESRSMLNKNPLISTFIDESKEHEKTLPDKGNISTVVGLIPSGYIQIIIKNLKINPERLEIKPGMFVLNITLGNDTNATSAQTHNEAINLCLSYVEKYNEMIRNTPINTTLSIKNPVSSQTDILTKFGKLIGKNKSLYQQLYMYFFIGINFNIIREYYLHTISDVNLLCRTDSIKKNEIDKDYINYSNFFDDSRIDKFIFLFTKIMNMLIDQDVRSITLKTISDLFELEIKLNADEYESLIELPSVPSSRALTLEKVDDTFDEVNALRPGANYEIDEEIDEGGGGSYNNSQEGGVDDFDHLACAKMVPMQITKLGTNPNNMIVTVTQMHIDNITTKDPPIPAPVKVDISVGDAIRFVENGEVVYGIICGFKSGKKKYLNGKIESNINIEDYWESAKSFTGDSGIAKLNELDIDQVVSIVNLRGIIYVRYEYDDDIGYGYCPEKAKDSTGKIIFNCNTDKELSMLPNGYNPSAASVAQKATSAIINTFKLGKSTPFGVGSYSEIQYSLKSYMTLAKVTPPKNFTEFVKELKTIRQPGVNSNYIQQLGGLINKHSLNDDCGRYGMKVADIASSQTAANFLNKVNATTRNYSGAMRGVFDMTKSNNFIVRNLLQINLTEQELKDTIYGVNANQSKLGVTIPKLIYGLMLRYPDYVTSMKLIFSALSDEKDDDIQGIITNISSMQGGGAKGNIIKQLIDALIDIIKEQKLLRMDIIGNLSSACDSAFSQYNIHDDSASFKTELNQSLTPSTRRISRDADSRNVETENASAPESRRSAALGSSIFQNLADKFVGKSGEVGNISSMGSTSCADAKVMCDNNGIIQVQINLQELLSNCLSSNGVVNDEMAEYAQKRPPPKILQSQSQSNQQLSDENSSNQLNNDLSQDQQSNQTKIDIVGRSSESKSEIHGAPYSVPHTEQDTVDQQTAIGGVNNAYIKYYDLYAKIKNDDSSNEGTEVGGGGNSIDNSIQIGGGLEDYIQYDDLPTDTIDTQYPDEKNARYKGVCRNQVPYLCGKPTNQKGFCRRNQADCNFDDFGGKSKSDNYIYQKPTDKDNDRYIYRAYFDRAEGEKVDEPELQSNSTLMPAMTGKNFFQELTNAKTQYDTSLSEYMPIATRINILEEYVKSITVKEGPQPTDLQKTALDLATKDLQALKSQSTSSSSEAVSLDVSNVNEATSVFINALTSIESEISKQPSSETSSSALLSSPDLTSSSVASSSVASSSASSADLTSDNDAKIEKIKEEYNQIIVYLSTFIDNFCSRTDITGNNIQELSKKFVNDLDTDLETLQGKEPFENFILCVKLLEDMIDKSIKVYRKNGKFNTISEYCKALKEIVNLYKPLSDDLTNSDEYEDVINRGTLVFIKFIVDNKKLNFNSRSNNFQLISSYAFVTGGSRSSRKHNSRKKNHRKSSSKARKSRRNTKSSSTSKNHKKVRFVKTS